MNIEIQVLQDDNFKILVKPFGEQFVATDSERVAIAPTEEQAVVEVVEMQQQAAQANRAPKPVPIENTRSTGMSWFSGTSWDTKQ